MADTNDCNWTKTVHWDRFVWNVKHLFNFKDFNPFYKETSGGKERKAYQDFWHSAVNVSVELAKVCPYRAGHIIFYENMVLIVIALSSLAGWGFWKWLG